MKFSDLIKENYTDNGIQYVILWQQVLQIPEFARLRDTFSNLEWHQEGSTLTHTMLVCQSVQNLLTFYDYKTDGYTLMCAALCHDLGKGPTTYWDQTEQNWHCRNHGAAGEKIVRELFAEDPLCDIVANLVRYHMELHYWERKHWDHRVLDKLRTYGDLSLFIGLFFADCLGTISSKSEDEMDTVNIKLGEYYDIQR